MRLKIPVEEDLAIYARLKIRGGKVIIETEIMDNGDCLLKSVVHERN